MAEVDEMGPDLREIPLAVARVIEVAKGNAVVGPALERDGRTVIPLAAVAAGYGFGLGFGQSFEEGQAAAAPSGGGGGGGARPVAVLELSEQGVRVHPVLDSTRITIASLLLAGWTVYWITKTVRAFRRR